MLRLLKSWLGSTQIEEGTKVVKSKNNMRMILFALILFLMTFASAEGVIHQQTEPETPLQQQLYDITLEQTSCLFDVITNSDILDEAHELNAISDELYFTGMIGGDSAFDIVAIKPTTPEISCSTFSFDEILQAYPEGSPGAKYTGFKNTVQYPITAPEEAILLAQQECSINYSEIALAYDEGRAIWQVIFFPVSENGHITLGGDQSVYLDTNGITQLIVYGE